MSDPIHDSDVGEQLILYGIVWLISLFLTVPASWLFSEITRVFTPK